jgi:Bacterial PH domain
MPIDRGIIDQQLEALGEGARWWNVRELRDLPAILDAKERILAMAHGKVARVRLLHKSWLIVVTDRRLLCMRSASRKSWRQFDVKASQISRVALRIGPFRGRVIVAANGSTYRLLMARQDANRIVNALSGIATQISQAVSGFAPARMVRRVVDHVLALPAVALTPAEPVKRLPEPPDPFAIDDRMHSLEQEVEELRRQIEFLEQLLRQHQS